MKILQVSTYDISGGAARAAYRLQKGLREMGHDSRMLVRHKNTKSVYVHSVSVETGIEEARGGFFLENVIQQHYITRHRTERSNTLFSFPYPGYDIARIPALNEADVINLHWIAQYQSPATLRNLSSLGKPVVWTLHDQWAFTGGCHYSAGCENYQADCTRCPQVTEDLWSLPEAVLKDKLDFFKGISFTLVTPSRWMADCIRKSRLFRAQRVEVIPNSLETDIFAPLPKETAKESFGLEKDTLTILFGGEDTNERRKGFLELVSAVEYLTQKDELKSLLEIEKVCVLCFGRPSEAVQSLSIPFVSLGHLGSDLEIRNAYCAADVFVLPSLEDNLPNTVLEAMSCGTPVVGFEIGGMPDMVENGVTGQLVPPGDAAQLGEAMYSLLLDSTRRQSMGEECRRRVESEYPLSVQARRYSALYEDVISGNKTKPSITVPEKCNTKLDAFVDNFLAPVALETTVGSHFERIYDDILFDALKESAFQIYQKWQDAELDRNARLQVIKDQGKRIVDLEAEVDRWLNESRRLKEYADHALQCQVSFETKSLQDDIKALEDHIVEIEADRVARLKVINDQGERIGDLEAEVDRWLNEGRRLQKAYEEVVKERDELSLKMMWRREDTPIKRMGRKLSFLSDRVREAGAVLKKVNKRRVAPDVAPKKTLSEGTAKRPESQKSNRKQMLSRVELFSFEKRIDYFNASQPNRKMLDDIRLFNHSMLDQFNSMFPLKGCTLLDVGASPHGYALERALQYGVALYAGIGLDIDEGEHVSGNGNNVALLLKMDAANLRFPDGMFDAVFSISVFEHVSDVPRVLSEIARVLRVGGCALISFEPVWSCSYGHHLHHFGECARLVPAWGHLIWSPDQMRDYLSERWPGNAPLLLDEAIEWIYHGDSINRLNIRQFKELFEKSGLTARWCMDLPDDEKNCNSVQLKMASEATCLAPDELMTKGLCMLLAKESFRM